MIFFDHAARQQNEDRIMNRSAPDFKDYREDRQAEEKGISWEDYIGIPVAPRRSPWRTANEDPESYNPKVSEKQVAATTQNIGSVNYSNTSSVSTPTSGSTGSINEAALQEAVLSPAIIQQITQAVLAALPIVEFSCPD